MNFLEKLGWSLGIISLILFFKGYIMLWFLISAIGGGILMAGLDEYKNENEVFRVNK